jgi:hypothetical protein
MSFVGKFEISPIVAPCFNLRYTKFPESFEPFLSNLDKVTGKKTKKLADWGISIDDTPNVKKPPTP